WRTSISLPVVLMRVPIPSSFSEFPQRFDTDGERREVGGTGCTHVGESALPVRQLFAGGLLPGRHALFSAAAAAAFQHALREPAVQAQGRIAQARACRGLPR